MEKKSKIFEIQNLNEMKGCRYGGYKRGSGVSYPGRSAYLPSATFVMRRRDGYAEVSREHSSSLDPNEGSNM